MFRAGTRISFLNKNVRSLPLDVSSSYCTLQVSQANYLYTKVLFVPESVIFLKLGNFEAFFFFRQGHFHCTHRLLCDYILSTKFHNDVYKHSKFPLNFQWVCAESRRLHVQYLRIDI